MKLTRERAIDGSIELWEWLAETGKRKEDWPRWEEFDGVDSHCFLCEYQEQEDPCGDNCDDCPLTTEETDGCYDTYYLNWCQAKSTRGRKKYAALFLEQLKELKK